MLMKKGDVVAVAVAVPSGSGRGVRADVVGICKKVKMKLLGQLGKELCAG